VAAAAGVELSDRTLSAAAHEDNLQLCTWLRETAQCPWPEYACMDAARRNQHALLRWLLDSGCPIEEVWDVGFNALVGCGNDLSVLQYLLEQGLLGDAQLLTLMLQQAGCEGNVAAAQWLRQQGAQWPAVLYFQGAQEVWNGEVLQWARAEGCTASAVLPI
jgi:hypothetical protein